MRLEHANGLQRIAEEDEGPPVEPAAVRRFVEAVLALSENPRPEIVERYLVASHALETPARDEARERVERPDERTGGPETNPGHLPPSGETRSAA